jgi:TolB protein
MHADLDGLLTDAQRLDLESHLAGCETCRAESESLSMLVSRLQSEFHNRWDVQDGPSHNVMSMVRSQTRRIVMSNRINFGLRAVAGIAVFFVLGFGLKYVISQLRENSVAGNINETSDISIPDNSADAGDRLLAFTKEENGNYDIYTIHADGSELNNLTNNPLRDANPIWSRDGKRIVFESDRTGVTQIFIMNADGSNVIQLTNENTEHSLLYTDDIRLPVWSPDDSRLLFVQKESDGKTNGLYSLDIENGTRILLASDTKSIGNASWSPNGEYIGYGLWEEVEPGGFVPHLYIVDTTGKNSQELSKYLSENEHIFTPYFWASDGRSIIFPASVYEENRETIYQLDPHENTLQALMTTKTVVGLYEWYGGVALSFDHNSAGQPMVWQRPDGTSAELDYLKGANPANCYIGRARSLKGNLVIGHYCKKNDYLSLYWTNVDGSQIQPLPELNVPIVNGGLTGLTLSPDEKFLTFNFESDDQTNLYIWDMQNALENPASQPIQILIADRRQFGTPSWQPVTYEDVIQVEQPKQEDNRLLAFTKMEDGNADIYTIRADGSDLTNLTNNPAQDVNPFWSPDGKRIAFESDRSGFKQIYLMNADGSDVIRLTNDEADHALGAKVGGYVDPWSPVGNELIISQWSPGKDHYILYTMNISNGSKKAVTDELGIYLRPIWSFDGQYVAYISFKEEKGIDLLYIVDTNGDNRVNITDLLPADENIYSLNYYWASDSRSVIFLASRSAWENNKSKFAVYETALDVKMLVEITKTSTPLEDWWEGTTFVRGFTGETLTWLRTDGTYSELKPYENCQMSSQSGHFGFSKRSSTGNIILAAGCPNGDLWFYWSNPDGTDIKQILETPIPITDGGLDSIYWSPDDRYVTLNIVSAGSTYLYTLNVENSSMPEPIVIGSSGTNYYNISWQPLPGKQIVEEKPTNGLLAFTSRAENGNTDIYTMHADGSNLTNITNDPANDSDPAWSPSGNKLSFVSDRDGDNNIYVMNPDGGDLTQLTDNPGYDGYFSWSPDGKKIIYSASSGSDANISQFIIMNADGTNKVTLTDPGSYIFRGWSSNGHKIVYLKQNLETNNPQDNEIHVMNIDGTNHYQWRAIIDEIKWTDDQHFIGHGWSGQVESPTWKISRFDANGSDPVELATTAGRVVALFNQTYLVEDIRTLNWYSSDGTKAPLKSWDYSTHCQKGGDRFMQDTSHTISPDGTHAFVPVYCFDNSLWFYYESADGSEFKQLTDFHAETSSMLERAWSPDGKYVIMTIANKDNDKTDLYLFDIEKMLKDITTQPIRLTTDETVKFEAIWQPMP